MNCALIVQVLNSVPLTAAVIKYVPIKKENITPQFVKKTSNVLLATNYDHVTYPLVIIDIESIKCRVITDTGSRASRFS